MFVNVSYLLYAVYALFIVAALFSFGDQIMPPLPHIRKRPDWALNGLTYAGYNIIGAVVILPVLRHLTSNRDAVISGVLAGPLAMIPALLFFIPMVAF